MLALVVRRLIDHEKVVGEFSIERLETVAAADVVGIDGGQFAAGLDDGNSAKGFAKGKVLLEGEAVPI